MNAPRFLVIVGTIVLVSTICVVTQTAQRRAPEVTVDCEVSRTDLAGLTSVMHRPSVKMVNGQTANMSIDHTAFEFDNSVDKNVVAVKCNLRDSNGDLICAPAVRVLVGHKAVVTTTLPSGESIHFDVATQLANATHR